MLITVLSFTLAAYPVAFVFWIMGASIASTATAFIVAALTPLVCLVARIAWQRRN
jgi:hypothetical protein